MDTFWLKAAAVIIVITAVIVGITLLWPAEKEEPKAQPKTFYDMARQDRETLLAEPNANDFENSESVENDRPPQTEPEPQKPAEPVVLYFTEVSEIDSIEADRIMQMIPSWRSIGRAPAMGYNAMVESCRLLIRRFPGTIYDYKARRALAQMPQRYRSGYGITAEELDLEHFKQQRPNTIPYNITEDD